MPGDELRQTLDNGAADCGTDVPAGQLTLERLESSSALRTG
jgi:hypothetical protein